MINRARATTVVDAPRGMDVVRRRRRRLPKIAGIIAVALALAAFAAWTLNGAQRSHGSAPVVERSTVVMDVARRGPLVISVAAQGIFVPEHVSVISAHQSGVVDEVLVKAGSIVTPGTVVARMDNPALSAAVVASHSALGVARANLASAREQARASVINLQAAVSDAEAVHAQDALRARTDESLVRSGLIPTVQYQDALIQEEKSRNDLLKSRSQVPVGQADARAKIAAVQAQVDGVQAQLAADVAQVQALSVRAARAGIVQSVDVDPGTSVAQYTQLARVADVRDLKVVLQVAETDLRSVAVGMPARVTTASGSAQGRIARIAPSAHGGSVAVDVTFPLSPPPGALPSANVDAVVQTARIHNAVSIVRPAGAADGTPMTLFKVVDGGTRLVRVHALLGRGSNDRIQVKSGIAPGDTVVVSDTSPFLDQAELRLR